MEFRAITKYIRISPRKTRLVADIIRGRNAVEAQQLLEAVNKRAARIIGKTLNSALSNARQKDTELENLWIAKIVIDGGPQFKRYMPRAMGRATPILHKTSHVTIVLSDQKPGVKPKALVAEEIEKQDEAKDTKKIKEKSKDKKKVEKPKKKIVKHVKGKSK